MQNNEIIHIINMFKGLRIHSLPSLSTGANPAINNCNLKKVQKMQIRDQQLWTFTLNLLT